MELKRHTTVYGGRGNNNQYLVINLASVPGGQLVNYPPDTKPHSLASIFMRHFVIIAYFFSCSTFVFGQIANNDLDFFSYRYDKNIIKKNKVETITIEMSVSEGKSSGKSIYHFDKEGILFRQIIQDTKGNIKREFLFTTNSHNDLISIIEKDYEYKKIDTLLYFKSYKADKIIRDSSSELPICYNYEYASDGNQFKTIINSIFGLGNNTKRVIINKFDSLHRIINSVETLFENEKDIAGKIVSNRDFFYNHHGKIEKEVEKLNGKYSWMANKGSINYVYDVSGKLICTIRTNAACYIYSYNEKGLITSIKMNMHLESDAFIDTETKIETFEKFSYTFRQ